MKEDNKVTLFRRKTWEELDNQQPKRFSYRVTVKMNNGQNVTQTVQAISPGYAKDYVLIQLYDRNVYNWLVTPLKSANDIYGPPNVKVQKLDGVRKTVTYYKIEVVTNEQYNNIMNMYYENNAKAVRY